VEELRDRGDVMLVATWVDGKCVSWRNHPTKAEALEAAQRR
jgi:hypothetical protein